MPVDTTRTIRSLPRSVTSKRGEPVRLELLAQDAGEELAAMYLAYEPRASFQGLPPLKDAVCVTWVQGMVRDAVNVVARSAEGVLIGHIALFPVNRRKAEMLVVVSPLYQNLGIGTELTRSIIAVAGELGFERIWLPVAAGNLRARHVYQKCGFRYVSDKLDREVEMELELEAAACGAGFQPAASDRGAGSQPAGVKTPRPTAPGRLETCPTASGRLETCPTVAFRLESCPTKAVRSISPA